MNEKELRILFMGTPEFAVASLKALVENGYNVVGVVTMPDKAAGRGYKLQPSAVKTYALAQGLPVLQPERLKDEAFLQSLRDLKIDLQIVVAFRMLPEVVWSMPPMGTFNLHSSLLPQYRGAAPINWAIINGEKETGVTTFFLTHEIDTGRIIFQEKTDITDDDNAESLHNRLMNMGAGLVLKTVDAIINHSAKAIPQNELFDNEKDLKSAPKIFKETCRINWDQSSVEVRDFIRGLSPYPTAWTECIDAKDQLLTFKIFGCEIVKDSTVNAPSGTIITDNRTFLHVVVNDGLVNITDLQAAGKKRMKVSGFLNGFKFSDNCRFA